MKTIGKILLFSVIGLALSPSADCLAQPVVQVSAGSSDVMFLKSDGSLWGMGSGLQSYYQPNQAVRIVASNVTAIAAGYMNNYFVKSDGSLWGMGDNSWGQLGNTNTNAYQTNFIMIKPSGVTAVATGDDNCEFVMSDGSLWGLGFNYYGQLGNNSTISTTTPVEIETAGVTAVAMGDEHTLYIRKLEKSTPELWVMGFNGDGQLGDATNSSSIIPVIIAGHGGGPFTGPQVSAIATGSIHSLYLKTDGTMYAFGGNPNGQLGTGTSELSNKTFAGTNQPVMIFTNVQSIAAGGDNSAFITAGGALWVIGLDVYGQLGDGNYTAGDPGGINYPEKIIPDGVTAVSVGANDICFIKDGNLWGMGDNNRGELGSSGFTKTNRPTLLVVGTPGYNGLTGVISTNRTMLLSYVGLEGTNYALDRCTSLKSPAWIPQATNAAGVGGLLTFSNSLVAATNNFWRVRSVP